MEHKGEARSCELHPSSLTCPVLPEVSIAGVGTANRGPLPELLIPANLLFAGKRKNKDAVVFCTCANVHINIYFFLRK